MKSEVLVNNRRSLFLVNMLVAPVADLYSRIMGVRFNTSDTLHILQVQVALLMLSLPVSASLLYYVAMLLWLSVALYKCRSLDKRFKRGQE